MIREGKRRLRRAISAPSRQAILSALRRHESDRQSLIGRSQFYDGEEITLEVKLVDVLAA